MCNRNKEPPQEQQTDDYPYDRDDGPFELSPERLPDGRVNQRRADALDKHARFVYEYDRD